MAAIFTMFGILDPTLVPKSREPIVGCGKADCDDILETVEELFQSEAKVPNFSSRSQKGTPHV